MQNKKVGLWVLVNNTICKQRQVNVALEWAIEMKNTHYISEYGLTLRIYHVFLVVATVMYLLRTAGKMPGIQRLIFKTDGDLSHRKLSHVFFFSYLVCVINILRLDLNSTNFLNVHWNSKRSLPNTVKKNTNKQE